MKTVGVISFQGDFEKHLRRLSALGVHAAPVRDPALIESLDGLVIPGGESTTIGMLLDRFGFMEPLRGAIADGMPVFGTCAGSILLADEIVASDQVRIGGLAVAIQRNAYGRQIESFEASLEVKDSSWPRWSDTPVRGVFIRAPKFTRLSENVDTLMEFEGVPVAVRQGNILAITFHPELTADSRVHAYFIEEMVGVR